MKLHSNPHGKMDESAVLRHLEAELEVTNCVFPNDYIMESLKMNNEMSKRLVNTT